MVGNGGYGSGGGAGVLDNADGFFTFNPGGGLGPGGIINVEDENTLNPFIKHLSSTAADIKAPAGPLTPAAQQGISWLWIVAAIVFLFFLLR